MVISIVFVLIAVSCVQWELSLMGQAASVANHGQQSLVMQNNFLGISFGSDDDEGTDVSTASKSEESNGSVGGATGPNEPDESANSAGSTGSGDSMGSGDSGNSKGSGSIGDSMSFNGSSESGNSGFSDSVSGSGSSSGLGNSSGSGGSMESDGSSGFGELDESGESVSSNNSEIPKGPADDSSFGALHHLFNFNPFKLSPPEVIIRGINGSVESKGTMLNVNDKKFKEGTVFLNTKQNRIYINGILCHQSKLKDDVYGPIEFTREMINAFQIEVYGSVIKYIDNLGAIVVVYPVHGPV